MSEGLVPAQAALNDIDCLERELEQRFSYLDASAVDLQGLLADLRIGVRGGLPREQFGLRVQRLLAHFVDGHAAIDARPTPRGYLPFLVSSSGGRLVAYLPDRSSLLDPEHPYLVAIDDVSIATWLEAASAYVAKGSPQLVALRSLSYLRAVQMLRCDLGLTPRETVNVTLASTDGETTERLSLDVAAEPPQFGTWPPPDARARSQEVGYLRLERMRPHIAPKIDDFMSKRRDSEWLIVDVRGNSGGTRDALVTLFSYLMAEDDEPRIANVSAHRLHPDYGPGHLADRQMYPRHSDHWTLRELAAIDRHASSFEPEWRPALEAFSDWHYFVLSPAARPGVFHYEGRLVVLADAGSFSATDVFLAALKGWRNVTVVGEPSSGGSGRATQMELPATGFRLRLSSMASFQANGLLFDGRGIDPDVVVHPEPEDFLQRGPDVQLRTALSLVRNEAPNAREPASPTAAQSPN